MLGLIGVGSLIKWLVAILGVAGVFFYGIYTEKQNANDRARKVIVEQLTKRNYESNKVADRNEDIETQAQEALEYAQNDRTDADICVSHSVLQRINAIR